MNYGYTVDVLGYTVGVLAGVIRMLTTKNTIVINISNFCPFTLHIRAVGNEMEVSLSFHINP